VLAEAGDLSSPQPLPIPADLGKLLRRRIAEMSEPASAVLRAAALMSDATVPTLQRVLDDADSVLAGVKEAAAAGLLRLDSERVRFTHPLLASAVTATTTAPTASRLHSRIADVSDDLEQRARHLMLAADGPAEDVASMLEAAGADAAARGARATAAELLELAAAMSPVELGEAHVRRTLAAAKQHHLSGDGQRAAMMADKLVHELPAGPPRAAALEVLAGVATSGPLESYFRQGLEEAADDPLLLGDLNFGLGMLLAVGGQREAASNHLERSIALLRAGGHHGQAARVMAELGMNRWLAGQGLQRELYEAALREAAHGPALEAVGRTPEWSFARQLLGHGEVARARPLLESALDVALEAADTELELDARLLLSQLELLAGDWIAADRLSREALDLAEQVQISNADTQCLARRAIVEAHMGALDAAREHAVRGADAARRHGDVMWRLRNHCAIGFVALSEGEPAKAVRALALLDDEIAQRERPSPEVFPARALLAEGLVGIGDLPRARRVVQALEDDARGGDNRLGLAMVLHGRALLHAADGDLLAGRASCEEAVDAYSRLALPFELARCLLGLGAIQRRAKLKRPARETLERAVAIFEELGAPLWAERGRAELSRIGGRQPSADGGLTATERRVAELAATGRTNKQIAAELFLSERTVEANLTKVYRKLGIRSRTELAGAWTGASAP
jgi:DNA-binding CsgD family transcriptional regulator